MAHARIELSFPSGNYIFIRFSAITHKRLDTVCKRENDKELIANTSALPS